MKRYSWIQRATVAAMMGVLKTNRFVPQNRDYCRVFEAEVVGLFDVAPMVRRLTLRAPEFADYVSLAPDDYFGLYIPNVGQDLVLPPGTKLNPRAELAKMDEARRPDLRWYTVRYHRPDACEIDVDIVKHLEGPGESFLARAAVGDVVGFREGVGAYAPPAGRQLIIGDEASAPAVAAILDSIPTSVDATVYIEAPSQDYLVDTESLTRSMVLYRGDGGPGSRLQDAIVDDALVGFDFAWVFGELSMVKAMRERLVRTGMDRRRIAFGSYWILGRERL